jgi:hypothetical protein
MAKRVIRFPRPPQADPEGPLQWATFQVGADRVVIDLRVQNLSFAPLKRR